MRSPFISICIPAYKKAECLKRLLDSIADQTFKDFEVVITDDSRGDAVQLLLNDYANLFSIAYKKNVPPLGSPENWNAAIRLARGEWIKMMHDDDWFENNFSVEEFASNAQANPDCSFLFSGFTEVDISSKHRKSFVINDYYLQRLKRSPLTLFKQNFIGHPSTTLVKNDHALFYDRNVKWVVDIEYYIRFLNANNSLFAIKKTLIAIGIHNDQITKQAFRNPDIEIPETIYLYYKLPARSLRNIFAYDYYWRFIRNLSIRSETDIKKYAPQMAIPEVIKSMIRMQSKWNLSLLKKGLVSKTLMLSSYLLNYRNL
jgi:glycosyltransferase involved in cell wall biosynthesis